MKGGKGAVRTRTVFARFLAHVHGFLLPCVCLFVCAVLRFREDRIDGQGTVKIEHAMPGVEDGEFFIPLEIQSDIRRIHYRAGFDGQGN